MGKRQSQKRVVVIHWMQYDACSPIPKKRNHAKKDIWGTQQARTLEARLQRSERQCVTSRPAFSAVGDNHAASEISRRSRPNDDKQPE